ncbi:MAG: hypothetical protein H6834_05040 [Planctomycetes bacterium]|nr:hypothetical protein [Planctomycetota bacterium]
MSSSRETIVRFPRTPRLLRTATAWTWNRRVQDSLPEQAAARLERDAFERGRDEERRRLRDAHDALRATREHLIALEHERLRTLEPEVTELALHIAERIVGEAIRQGRHDVQKLVSDALRGLRGVEDERIVHLNPRDLETLRRSCVPDAELSYEADPDVAPGSCHVITPYGTIVRDVDLLMREVRTRVREHAATADDDLVWKANP